MQGPRARILALGTAIEDWPIILPHYRSVVLREKTRQPDGIVHRVATMKAWRPLPFGRIPVGWKTTQDSSAETSLLHFVHIGGFTKGMDVYWRLTPEGDATRVTITHDFTLRWPLIGDFVAHRIVGQFFVDAIARRTLNRIREIVEMEVVTPPSPLHSDEMERASFDPAMPAEGHGVTMESPLAIASTASHESGHGDERPLGRREGPGVEQ
jgi:hypothetical protein